MRNRTNNILIGLLWLLAISLGASFWFNTQYGFNIFSLQHWQYLAYMQATAQPVRGGFYISLLVIVVIAVLGLYKLLQPKYRKIVLSNVESENTQQVAQAAPVVQEVPTTKIEVPKQAVPETPVPMASTPMGIARPPRLNIPTVTRTTAPAPRVPLTSTTPSTPKVNPEQEYADIHEIFTSAGYVYKGSPRIKNIQTSVIAIGTNEVLWIGATGISTTDMQRAVDTLNGVFADTLDDIEINVNAFIIGVTDNVDNSSIMHFASVDELRAFINEHTNTPPDEDEQENFDAYSGYIGTVVDYIGKI